MSCQEANFPQSPPGAELGTKAGTVARNDRCCQNRSGRSARVSSLLAICAILPCPTSPSTASYAAATWVTSPEKIGRRFMFPSRFHDRPHISTRQYGRLVRDWVTAIGLEPSGYGTHSLRRTKAAKVYRKTGNLRAVQLLLGHRKVDSTVRYLGVELENALSIAERIVSGASMLLEGR